MRGRNGLDFCSSVRHGPFCRKALECSAAVATGCVSTPVAMFLTLDRSLRRGRSAHCTLVSNCCISLRTAFGCAGLGMGIPAQKSQLQARLATLSSPTNSCTSCSTPLGPSLAGRSRTRCARCPSSLVPRSRHRNAALSGLRPATTGGCIRVLETSWPQMFDPRWPTPCVDAALARRLPALRSGAWLVRWRGIRLRRPRSCAFVVAYCHAGYRACGHDISAAICPGPAGAAHLAGTRRDPGGRILA
ncbi:hypothetical protein DO64_4653 [Burkholderia pseudomallei]|nr:hypothetical protein DO64_4653 [Burkholderia pseudomallei]